MLRRRRQTSVAMGSGDHAAPRGRRPEAGSCGRFVREGMVYRFLAIGREAA